MNLVPCGRTLWADEMLYMKVGWWGQEATHLYGFAAVTLLNLWREAEELSLGQILVGLLASCGVDYLVGNKNL